MKKRNIIILPALLTLFLFIFCACEIKLDDFSIKCDENDCTYTESTPNSYTDGSTNVNTNTGESTGLGKEINVSKDVEEVCNYVLNSETTMIRLYRCPCKVGSRTYDCLYSSALPGGGQSVVRPGMGSGDPAYQTEAAKEAISIARYIKGAYTVEQTDAMKNENTYEFAKAFMILFKGDFFHDYRLKVKNGELEFPIGTCTQCYSDAVMKEIYDSGKYKDIIDKIYEETKYLIMVNDDGTLTGTDYAGVKPTGPTFVMEKWSKEGMNYLDILKKTRTSDESPVFKTRFKTSNVYDCRNLSNTSSSSDSSVIETHDITKINRKIIYLGDSRTKAYDYIKSQLGIIDGKERIIAKAGATVKESKDHMITAQTEMLNYPNLKYAVTVNYGANDLSDKNAYCAQYKAFVSSMNSNNQFYIISVTPLDDDKNPWHKNADIVNFNTFMKDTCIPEIKQENPEKEVYYCDIYGKIPLKDWEKYIDSNDQYGEHYNNLGSKFIYENTKACILEKQ